MQQDIDRVLLTHEQIAQRIDQLAGQITADHSPPAVAANGGITIISILTGSMIFTADLIRRLPLRMQIGLLAVSSYPGTSTQSKGAALQSQQLGAVRGRHVLLIDDILDSGGTIRLVRQMLIQQQPAGLRTCVLLRKATAQAQLTPVDYVGFDIPDEFVVGFGLDFNDYYRNLPDIVTLRPDVIRSGQPAQ